MDDEQKKARLLAAKERRKKRVRSIAQPSEGDLKEEKKRIRAMNNRLSAQKSRKKRLDSIKNLEEQLLLLESSNNDLQSRLHKVLAENARLQTANRELGLSNAAAASSTARPPEPAPAPGPATPEEGGLLIKTERVGVKSETLSFAEEFDLLHAEDEGSDALTNTHGVEVKVKREEPAIFQGEGGGEDQGFRDVVEQNALRANTESAVLIIFGLCLKTAIMLILSLSWRMPIQLQCSRFCPFLSTLPKTSTTPSLSTTMSVPTPQSPPPLALSKLLLRKMCSFKSVRKRAIHC